LNDVEQKYREFLDGATEEWLNTTVRYATTEGDTFTNTTGEILLHVALHSAYHRGQVNAAIRRSGGEPAVVDYIYFLRGE
jgi:uncharacterized damage-inducible protein DinB